MMKINWDSFKNINFYLEPVASGNFTNYYLYASIALGILAIVFRAWFFIKGNRLPVYRFFDKLWFWGGLSFSLSGLFVFFARTQGLPFFSTRAASYLWLMSVILYSAYTFFYLKKYIPGKLEEFHEKKRKSKYLKK